MGPEKSTTTNVGTNKVLLLVVIDKRDVPVR